MLESSARHRRIGIGLVTLTTLCFAMLDTAAKWLVLSLPVLQVVWLRFLTHSLFSLAIFSPSMGLTLVRWRHPRLQLVRGIMLAVMTGMNFWALQYLQLAQTSAMQFSVPERTRTGKRIHATPAAQVLAQPVEQGFTHAVGCGAQARLVEHLEHAAPPLSANDADFMVGLPSRTRRGWCFFRGQ